MIDKTLECGPPGSADHHCASGERAAKYLFTNNRRDIDTRIVALYNTSLYTEKSAGKPDVFDGLDPAEPFNTLLCRTLEPRARMDAAWKLGKIQSMAAGQMLVKALREGDETAQVCAATALVSVGVPMIEPLIAALKDRNVEVRRKVIWVLWSLGDRKAVKPLIACLRDEDRKVRGYAAWALGRLGDPRAILPLITVLDDPHDKVRWDAAIALAKFGEQAIPYLVEVLLYDDRASVRVGAANALGWLMDARAISSLSAALKDVSPQVRQRAAFALGWIKDARAVDALVAALGDEDDEVRMQAAAALGWIRDNRAIEPLSRLIEDESEWTRYAAIEALADMQAAAPLKHALKNSRSRVQHVAYRALRRLLDTGDHGLTAH